MDATAGSPRVQDTAADGGRQSVQTVEREILSFVGLIVSVASAA
jgi:hypothetical protein